MFDVSKSTTVKCLANALHTYLNYDEIAKQCHHDGCVMKEDKLYYAFTILSFLENKFKGMSKEDIEFFLILCSNVDDDD